MLGSIARRSVVQPAFRNEDPGAAQPQKSQPRDGDSDAERLRLPSHPGRVN